MRVASAPAARRTTSPRTRLWGRAALFALIVGFAVSVAGGSGTGATSGRLGGDFPAFYAAGSIVAEGDWAELYDPERQHAEQAALFGDRDEGYLYFAYPPHAASLYRPLAALDYRVAYVAHSVAMVGALVSALALIRPLLPRLDRHFELAVTASLLFYPLLRAVTGGQNTAVTMLLLAATWRALHEDHHVVAGLATGLLLYKPQFAVPLIGLLMLARHWRAVLAALITGAMLWAAGAVVLGVGWLGRWWSEASAFAELDAEVNGHNAVSWLGFAEAVFGAASTSARLVAAPLMVATVVALCWLWLRRAPALADRMALTVVGLVLLSPHAMFYDVGLLVLPAVVVADRLGSRTTVPLALAWVLAWTQLGAEGVGLAPLFPVILAASLWMVLALYDRTGNPSTLGPGAS